MREGKQATALEETVAEVAKEARPSGNRRKAAGNCRPAALEGEISVKAQPKEARHFRKGKEARPGGRSATSV